MKDLTDARDRRRTDPKTLRDALEAMIDKDGMEAVGRAIQAVCELKSDHVGANWQDRELAKRWARCAITAELLGDRAKGL